MPEAKERIAPAATCKGSLSLVVVLVACLCGTAYAARRVEQPQALRLRSSNLGLRFRMEMDEEDRLLKDTGESTRYESEVLSPSLTVGLGGSVFHPNLLTFSLGGEYGLSIEETEINDPGQTEASGSVNVLDYDASIYLLQAKPYPVLIYADRGRQRLDYDLFTRVTYERQRFGTQLQFINAFAPLRLTWEEWEEETVDEQFVEAREERRIDFRAINSRGNREKTDFRLLYEEFDQRSGDGLPFNGNTLVGDLTDARVLNEAKRARLTSSLSYRTIESDQSETKTILFREEYRSSPSTKTDVRANYIFTHQSQGESRSDRHTTYAALNHELYASLASEVSVNAGRYEVSGGGIGDSGSSYRLGIAERYDKKLGDWGKLHVNIHMYRGRDERSSATATTRVIRESVVLVDGQPSLLDSPNIDLATVEVTDSSGTRLYTINTDYILLTRGEFTEIQRLLGGNIPQGSTVRVSYLATVDSDVNLDSSDRGGKISLDFMDDRCNVFAEIARTSYSGDDSLAFQNVDNRTVGASYAHGWFSVRVSKQVYESDSIVYDTLRASQTVSWNAFSSGHLSLEGNQSRTQFEGEDSEQSIDTYILRYGHKLSQSFYITGMIGLRDEVVDAVARDAITGEMTMNWKIGLLELDLSHWFSDDVTAAEETRTERTVVRLERKFW